MAIERVEIESTKEFITMECIMTGVSRLGLGSQLFDKR